MYLLDNAVMIRILIADDDLITRLLLSEYLSTLGNCDTVVDGIESVRAHRLALQRNKPYDLICLDIMMPHMDGMEALNKIRGIEKENGIQQDKQAIIIMVTALVDELNRTTALDAKCDGYITKPIEHNELIKTINDIRKF